MAAHEDRVHLAVNTHNTVCYGSTASRLLRTTTGLPIGSGLTLSQRRVATRGTGGRSGTYNLRTLSIRGQLAFFLIQTGIRWRYSESPRMLAAPAGRILPRATPTTLGGWHLTLSRLCTIMRLLLRTKTWLMHLRRIWHRVRSCSHAHAGQLSLLKSQNLHWTHLVGRLCNWELWCKQQRGVLVTHRDCTWLRLLALRVLVRFIALFVVEIIGGRIGGLST